MDYAIRHLLILSYRLFVLDQSRTGNHVDTSIYVVSSKYKHAMSRCRTLTRADGRFKAKVFFSQTNRVCIFVNACCAVHMKP